MNAINRLRADLCRSLRGYAAIEFALIFPVILALIGGVTDFGLYILARSRLADAVAYGTQYAFLSGTAAGANASINAAVTKVARATLTTATVSVTGPACYCTSGTNPPTLATQNCGTNCPITLALPGQYVIIQGSYVYAPIFPTTTAYLSNTMYENSVVRVK